MSKGGLGGIVALVFVGVVIFIAIVFTPHMMTAADNGVDLNGTQYETLHNSTTQLTVMGLNIGQGTVILIFAAVLIGAVSWALLGRGGKGR